MPRFGFAYSLNNNTVIRGGYGLYYSAGGIRLGNSNQTGFSLTTPLIPSLDGGLSFVATLANPYPNGVLDPPKSSLGSMTFVGQGISFFNQKPITPSSVWSASGEPGPRTLNGDSLSSLPTTSSGPHATPAATGAVWCPHVRAYAF